LLRRLPRAVRELQRQRAGRPPFRVEGEHDLEYVLRGFLPLCCDDVRLRSRTPAYSPGSRTDFLLMPGGTVLVAKFVVAADCEGRLAAEIRADAEHHGRQRDCCSLVVFVYDPLGFLRPAERLEAAWSVPDGDRPLRCVIAG
jgi:hypothetical protein